MANANKEEMKLGATEHHEDVFEYTLSIRGAEANAKVHDLKGRMCAGGIEDLVARSLVTMTHLVSAIESGCQVLIRTPDNKVVLVDLPVRDKPKQSRIISPAQAGLVPSPLAQAQAIVAASRGRSLGRRRKK